jgi:hypothetical protein
VVLGARPADAEEDGSLAETWDGRWFKVRAGGREVVCPVGDLEVLDEEGREVLAFVPAEVLSEGAERWVAVTLAFRLEFVEDGLAGEYLHAFAFGRRGAREVVLEAGDSVRPLHLVLGKDGEDSLRPAAGDSAVLVLDGEADLDVVFEDVPPGRYLVGFLVRDLAGHEDSELVQVDVTD